MPDEVQPQPATPVVIVDDTKTKGALGTNANTVLQYGQFGILLTALTVGGPWLWKNGSALVESIHTKAVEKSATTHKEALDEAKAAREDAKADKQQFLTELKTILKDHKDERKEVKEESAKTTERLWAVSTKNSEKIVGAVEKLAAETAKGSSETARLLSSMDKLTIEIHKAASKQ